MVLVKTLLAGLALTMLAGPVQCADPVLTPPTLTDSVSNAANEASDISWAALPAGKTYKTDATYDDGGMGALFDFARSFINTAMPGGFPSALVKDLTGGNFDIGADYMKIVEALSGYGACIVIGFLFMIIFTIIGCCLCCCRTCCNNCGGKMIQKRSGSSSCRRKVYGVILLVLVVFTTVGCICIFVSNDRMTTAINKYSSTVNTNLDDMTSFLDNTVSQVEHLLGTDLNFAFDVVQRDLNNVDVLVGIPVRDELDTAISANNLFNSIGALQTDVDEAVQDFRVVETDVNDFKTSLTTLDTDLDTWILAYNADSGSCGTCPNGAALKTNIDASKIDVTATKTEIDNIESQNMETLVSTARDDFNNIPGRVKNESQSEMASINNAITSYKSDITPIIDSIKDVQNSFIDLDNIKSEVKTYTDTAEPFDQYRWYGGIGLACIVLLVVVLQFVGLAFSVCGSSADTLPTERSCLSHAGGNMLMASVGFIFIFSWLLMFLTTLCFMLGAPVERYVCQSLADPELKVINELLTDTGIAKTPSGGGSWIGQTIFGDSTIDLTIQDILKDCKADKTAYTAFKLENLKGFNLSVVTNYKSSIDIENQLNNINVDFTTIEVAPQSLKDNLQSFKNSVTNTDFATYQTELSKDATGTGLEPFLNGLNDGINAMGGGPAQTNLRARHTELEAIRDNQYANTITAKNKLSASLGVLETTFNGIPAKIDNLLLGLDNTETALTANGNTILHTVLTTYTNRIFGVVDSLISRAVGGLKDDLAKCKPVYNLYQSLVVIGFCQYMIDAFNGFWFSLGWCIFFFVPSVVFAVKLAKHFRKMKYLDDYDSTLPSKNNDVIRNGSPPPAYSFGDGNKVGHSDKF